ncbi:hypothetical protein DMA11_23035 [Marinilabiliaceae bacterium JC017]|nr:hypothetical protein DMA11_23035 [Marinilabiliaceae bacterium JC017]
MGWEGESGKVKGKREKAKGIRSKAKGDKNAILYAVKSTYCKFNIFSHLLAGGDVLLARQRG